jgi:hypothetical protein
VFGPLLGCHDDKEQATGTIGQLVRVAESNVKQRAIRMRNRFSQLDRLGSGVPTCESYQQISDHPSSLKRLCRVVLRERLACRHAFSLVPVKGWPSNSCRLGRERLDLSYAFSIVMGRN